MFLRIGFVDFFFLVLFLQLTPLMITFPYHKIAPAAGKPSSENNWMRLQGLSESWGCVTCLPVRVGCLQNFTIYLIYY